MADPQGPVTEWDAQGKPVSGASGATEWDASGKPVSSSPASGVMTEQSEHARQLAPARPIDTSLLSRFGQATGIPPLTREGLTQAGQGMAAFNSPTHPVLSAIGNAILGPGGAMIKNYGQNIYNKATAPMTPAEQADMQVHPVGQVANQASKFLLEGPLGPFGGQAASNLAQDVGTHANAQPGHPIKAMMHGDVMGDALGGIVNALLLRSGANPSTEARLNSLTAAGGAKTAIPFENLAKPLLDTADAAGIKPQSVKDVRDVVNKFKDNVNAEYGNAIGPYANQKILPLDANGDSVIASRIRALKDRYPNIDASDREAINTIEKAAQDYDKPITIGELDRKRSLIAADLASHNAKEAVGRYTAERGNVNVAVDNAILGALRDEIYPRVDAMAGKPTGYFEQLKQQQSDGIRLQSLLNKRIEDLTGKSRESKGQTSLSRLRPGMAISAEGAPHGFVSNVFNAISPKDVLKSADAAAERGMGKGNPVSKALVMSYPARILALSQQPLIPVDQQK